MAFYISKVKKTLASVAAIALLSFNSSAQEIPLDQVIAVVDSGVVLKSEVDDLVASVKNEAIRNNQSLPSDEALHTQALEKLIVDSILVQRGERMGIQIGDAQLDETITRIARENQMTLDIFRKTILDQGLEWDKYRENVRTELITGEVRRGSVRRRIYVSPQEVSNLVEVMQAQTNQNIEYSLGHILIDFPTNANQEDMSAAKERADKVVELLNEGSDFKRIAIASSGAANALEGGVLDWMTINEMPTLFSELISDKEKGAVLGPVRTGLGYSIVKILDVRGKEVVEVTEVKSRHILIEPTVILSEAKAENMLKGFLAQIEAGEADFDELARKHSDGPTSTRGGDLGWADPNTYDPAFRDALATLEVDQFHAPFRSSFGWHLVQLTGRRTLDATSQINSNKAYQILYNRQFSLENARWTKEIREEAFIEIFDEVN